ncbi:MAG: hypothetical protein ACREBU_25700, partial [Nitrososphaera sp.]
GQGLVKLQIPQQLASNIFHVRSNSYGGNPGFSMNTANGTLTIENLSYYPRHIALFYTPDLVPTSPMSLFDLVDNPITTVRAGEQVIIKTTLENLGEWEQNSTAIVEVRDENGVTVALAWVNSAINPEGTAEVGVSWRPEETGEYTARVFVLSSLDRPEILSGIKRLSIDVDGETRSPELSSDKTTYEIGEQVAVTIRDAEANLDPSSDDSLTSIRVFSASDRVGKNFTAEETGDDTGIFEFFFETSASVESDKILVRAGDEVTIAYTNVDGNEFTLSISILGDDDERCRFVAC